MRLNLGVHGLVLIISLPSDRPSYVHPTKMIRAIRPREYLLPSMRLFREVDVVNDRAFSEDFSVKNGKFRSGITSHKTIRFKAYKLMGSCIC